MQLRDGRQLRGRYVGGTTTSVGFMTDRAVEYFPISSVLVLLFDPSEADYKSGPLVPEPVRARVATTRGATKRRAVAKLRSARLVSP